MSLNYPEHGKLSAVKEQSQAIGSFLDWLQNERSPTLTLCVSLNHADHPFQPSSATITKLLAEYFEIDLEKLESEKLAMLDECRREHAKKAKS